MSAAVHWSSPSGQYRPASVPETLISRKARRRRRGSSLPVSLGQGHQGAVEGVPSGGFAGDRQAAVDARSGDEVVEEHLHRHPAPVAVPHPEVDRRLDVVAVEPAVGRVDRAELEQADRGLGVARVQVREHARPDELLRRVPEDRGDRVTDPTNGPDRVEQGRDMAGRSQEGDGRGLLVDVQLGQEPRWNGGCRWRALYQAVPRSLCSWVPATGTHVERGAETSNQS